MLPSPPVRRRVRNHVTMVSEAVQTERDLDAKIARLHQEVATFDENARDRDTRDAVVKKTKPDRGWLVVTFFFCGVYV